MKIKLGAKIKKNRLEKGMTLDELALRIGLTKSYLSKIENNKSQPTLSTLVKIAGILKINMSDLFPTSKTDPPCSIVKKNEGKRVNDLLNPYGFSCEVMAHKKRNKKMHVFFLEFPPDADEITIFQHEGEEILYVLEGKAEFVHGDERHIVEEGDCVYFECEYPHGGRCYGDVTVKILDILYMP
ncbi:MAG: XRE family transcriptional regulator [Desulfobacteria bacterium]